MTAAAIAGVTVYCALFLMRPRPWWPNPAETAARLAQRSVFRVIDLSFTRVFDMRPGSGLRVGTYLIVVAGVLPWLAAGVLRRGRPFDLGIRRPNRLAWRVVVVGYVLALPCVVWMTWSPTFAGSYLDEWRRAGSLAFCAYYAANMTTEHFLIHGVVLGLCRAGGRWPPAVGHVDGGPSAAGRLLRWIGLDQPRAGATGMRGTLRWIGLPPGCVPATVTSAILFAGIHVGKDERELLLSVPGGVLTAYLAYRTNTWLTTLVLHVATAGTAFLLIVVR